MPLEILLGIHVRAKNENLTQFTSQVMLRFGKRKNKEENKLKKIPMQINTARKHKLAELYIREVLCRNAQLVAFKYLMELKIFQKSKTFNSANAVCVHIFS